MTTFVSDVSELLGRVPPVTAYAIVALALIVESNLLVGVLVPTLTMMLTAGALAGAGHLNLPVLIGVAAASVVTADLIGFHTGRLLGPRLRASPLGRRLSAAHWARAEQIMARHGGRAVLPARFVPVLRSLVPHLAGATGVPYRRVAPYSVTAAIVWATVEAGVGYAAANSLHLWGAVGLAAVAVVVIAVACRRRAKNAVGSSAWRFFRNSSSGSTTPHGDTEFPGRRSPSAPAVSSPRRPPAWSTATPASRPLPTASSR